LFKFKAGENFNRPDKKTIGNAEIVQKGTFCKGLAITLFLELSSMRKSLSLFVVVLLVLFLGLPVNAEDLQIYLAQDETSEPLEDQDETMMAGVYVKDIIIEGNTVIDTETLNKLVEPFKDRELSLEEMGELTDLITMTYQEEGYILARAYLPEQEIVDGVIKIAIAEGKIGKIKVSGYTHYKEDVLKRYFQHQQKHGVIKESLLEKGLLMTTDIPNVKTSVILKEGEQPGEVDVILDTKDTSVVTFGLDMSLDYNNYGSDLVGEDRYGTAINISDHYIGSKLAFRIVSGGNPDDSALFTGEWAIPINTYGTNVALDYLHSNYGVGQALAELGMTGRTEMYGVKIVHPIFKKKNMNLQFSFGHRNKYNKNIILDATRSIDELKEMYAFFNFDNLDRFLGKNIVSFGYTWGAVEFDKTVASSRLGADRGFDRYSLNVARIQKIYGYTNIMLRAAAQYSDKRLVPMEQYGIGGYGTVRGYKPSAGLGDSGYSYSAELMLAPPFIAEKTLWGQRIAQLVQFAIFWDHGQVYTTDYDATLDDYEGKFLTGYGFGVRLFYKDRFTLKYDLGVPKYRAEDEPKHFHYVQGSWQFF